MTGREHGENGTERVVQPGGQGGGQPPRMPVSEPGTVGGSGLSGPPKLPGAPALMAAPLVISPDNDERNLGMVLHLLSIFTGIWGVLILWLVKKDSSRFLDFHGKEALNFQLTVMLVTFSAMIIGVVTMVGLLFAVPLVLVVAAGALVCEILACAAAYRGEWHRYPLAIRFIQH